jgi:phosphatidate cytidylyltransferase
MNLRIDRETYILFGGVLAVLVVSSIAGWILQRRIKSESAAGTIANLNARIRAWWGMVFLFSAALATGGVGSVLLFAFTSFWALREFITLAPTRRGDHRTLFWVFFLVTPLQYYLVYIEWYGLFIVLIPVYAFLILAMRSAVTGDCERFLERTAKIQWALMICVYCVSHAPALLTLKIRDYDGENAKLLFWFVLVVQISDVLQYIWGKTLGRHKIAPTVSPNKTLEGFVGGTLSASLVGAALYRVTPFTFSSALGMAIVVTFFGFFGGIVMSAIKRDRGIKDFGSAIAGHGGVLDRIDSLCFAAPVFYHLTRFFFTD